MKALSLNEFCQQTTERYIETYMKSIGLKYIYPDFRENVRTYVDFLNQPFTPEMIVEKFKGWEYNLLINCCQDKKYNMIELYHHTIHIWNYDTEINTQFPIPRTLSDFINDCQRAGIELEFKEVK